MRHGIIAAGNWIIDHVKIIEAWPERGMLANIREEVAGGGGSPYNVLVDLARMKTDLPLWALGVIGQDSDGQYILDDLRKNTIDAGHITQSDQQPTSYTDVMTEQKTGSRTFFHCRGANALLGYPHFADIDVPAKIFHLGYLLLLDKLDQKDKKFGVVAARVLSLLRQKGYKTSVDVVSEQSNRFKKTVVPCLPHVDYLILNEIEAGATTGCQIRKSGRSIDANGLRKAAQVLFKNGVNKLVCIHFPEGGYACTKKNQECFVPSFLVKKTEIKSTVGAGDAFCAGMLYGLHQGWPLEKTLKLANANARFNLLSTTSTGGAVTLAELEKHMGTAAIRKASVRF
jgi:sugar/nucleoside kinase (ribokinase family)